ncbi:hypothetical protein [Plantibacter sp. YIM 135347]|uniref:hypothetical protein n=1 Tax=Plantibacter sp. YIM 135347 TaxID=3423919 RepID=UPI003D34944F
MSGEPVSAVGARFFPVTQRVARGAVASGALRGAAVAVADPALHSALAGVLEQLGARVDDEVTGGPLAETAPLRDAIARSASIAAAESSAWAEVALRHFARRTNLLLASTETLVVGDGPVAEHLQSALAVIGARSTKVDRIPGAGVGESGAVVFATREGHEVIGPDSIGADSTGAGATHPLVIVDAARVGSAVDRTAFATGDRIPAREGIEGFQHGREVFLLDRPDQADPALANTTADLTTALALASLSSWAAGQRDVDTAFADAERTLAEETNR